MIERLHSELAREGFELSGEELAEVLWLALRRGGQAADSEQWPAAELAAPTVGPEPAAPVNRVPTPNGERSSDAASTVARAPAASIVLPDAPASSGGGMTFQTPGASALPAAGEFVRALRPLRRRAPSMHEFTIDEDATARRILEQRLWLPVLRARKAPWYELAVVADGAGSMAIWEPTIREFVQLLGRLGAFRDVRTWTLDTEEAGPRLCLHPGVPGHPDRVRDASALTDPTGRRLIWLITDGIAAAWSDGRVPRMLARWSELGQVALIGVLPERLWPGTALSDNERCRIHTTLRGPGRISLHAERVRRRPNTGGRPIPVAALEPRQLGLLAQALVATLADSVPGLLLRKDQVAMDETEPDGEAAEPGPEERVRRFDAVGSPTARQLARLFAAAPLSLPVMRLIQQTAMPGATHGHLAEVFLGGLIEEIGEPGPRGSADDRRYDFFAGVREQLLRDSRPSESLAVLRRVSHFIADKLGQPRDFRTQLIAAVGSGRAFAEVAATVLLPLGGEYRRLAEELIGDPTGGVQLEQMRPSVAPQVVASPTPIVGYTRNSRFRRMRHIFAISDLHIGGASHPMLGHPEVLIDFLDRWAALAEPTKELIIHGNFVDFLAEAPYQAVPVNDFETLRQLI